MLPYSGLEMSIFLLLNQYIVGKCVCVLCVSFYLLSLLYTFCSMQIPITPGHRSLLADAAYPRGKWGPEVGAFPTSMAHISFEELTVLEAGLLKALSSTAPTLGPGASSSHPPSEALPGWLFSPSVASSSTRPSSNSQLSPGCARSELVCAPSTGQGSALPPLLVTCLQGLAGHHPYREPLMAPGTQSPGAFLCLAPENCTFIPLGPARAKPLPGRSSCRMDP